ncbi:MAG: hypothetical protein V1662_03545 [Candidatus Omnitrophota bacterium]
MTLITLPPYLAAYQQELKIALISLFFFLISGLLKKKSLFHYLFVCIPCILTIYAFICSPYLPDGDTWKNFSREFIYLAGAVSKLHFLPQWFPSCGGIRIGFFHIISLITLPHKMFGYYLYSFMSGNIILSYKLQYIAGIILMCFGWWLVLRKLSGCRWAAYFGTLMIMMGGTGIALHQEQVLGTTYLAPWFVLSFLKMRDDSSYIFPALVLFGLSLNTHLPQIHIIAAGLFILLFIAARPSLLKKLFKEQRGSFPLLIVLFIIAILPTLYLLRSIDNLSSAHRDAENIMPRTYEAYLATNCQGYSSALPVYFKQYIQPRYRDPVDDQHGLYTDRQAFFVGRLSFLLILIGLIFNFRQSGGIALLLICFVILTLGKNSFVPVLKLLYNVRFPFIRIFREWYHFFPFVNFCLSALAALGMASIARFSAKNKISRILFFLAVIPLLFAHITDLALYDKGCISTFCRTAVQWDNISNFRTVDAREGCGSGFFIQYKNRYRLAHSCPQAIPGESFLTTDILSVEGGENEEFKKVCASANEGKNTTVGNIPPRILADFPGNNSINRSPVPASLDYDGLSFDINVPYNALLVTPLNYDLGVNGYVDGKKSAVWRINSALCGMLIAGGSHRVELKVAPDAYTAIIWTQLFLYFFLAAFFIYKYIRPAQYTVNAL